MCVCVLSLQVYYAKFPPNIDEGTILLLYPVLGERERERGGGREGERLITSEANREI